MEELVVDFVVDFIREVEKSCRRVLLGSAAVLSTSLVNAAIITAEYEQFYLQYDDVAIGEFGTPIVGGNTIFFLPTNMAVSSGTSSSGFPILVGDIAVSNNDTWTTSFAVIPKDGLSLNSVTLTEQGDYSHSINTVREDQYDVNARLFIRDINNPADVEFHQFDYSFGKDEEVELAFWGASQSYSTTSFRGGYWLTVQNSLTVQNVPQVLSDSDYIDLIELGNFGSTFNLPADLFLQKKYLGFEINLTPVPLPASLWFMTSALALLGICSRARRSRL